MTAESLSDFDEREKNLGVELAEKRRQLSRLNEELLIIHQQVPDIEKEYADVQEELSAALEKANSDDEKSHNDAMIVSFRFNRIDRKYRRFYESKQEVQDGVDELNKKIAELEERQLKIRRERDGYIASMAIKKAEEEARIARQQAAQMQQQLARAAASEPTRQPVQPSQKVPVQASDNPAASKPESTAAQWPGVKAPLQAEIAFARAEIRRLSSLVDQKAPLSRVRLRSSCTDSIDLDFLGENIFTAVLSLSEGFCSFEIFNRTFWSEIPSGIANRSYRMIYDVTSISDPKFYLFEERILKE